MQTKALKKILKETFGYSDFRSVQLEVIESVIAGHDVLTIMPTGGGKSLCYQIPAIYMDGIALIVSPLISLMQDQVMNLDEYNIKAAFLNSSQSFTEFQETKESIRKGEIKILYVSPEGLLSPKLLDFLKDLTVSLIAIDEAHCVSAWGHEFRKDYIRLGELKDHFPNVPTIALTATADERTRKDIIARLRLNDEKVFLSSFDRPNIRYMIYERKEELIQLEEFIRGSHSKETGIVYCLSRAKVERVAQALQKKGLPAVPYHAGLSSHERELYQRKFSTEEHIIVVATIAFGMGINRPDVRFVAHLDLPKSIESYYQETGRAGRDGKEANAWMVYGLSDIVKLAQMLETTEAGEAYKKVARTKLDAMLSLCERTSCRRHYLLGYFGEAGLEKCGYCDICEEPPKLWDATVNAQKMLSTIYRTGQNFGSNHLIDVIRGSKNSKVLDRRHDQLSVYGIGKDHPKEHWNSVLRQLLSGDFIFVKDLEYRSLALGPKAHDLLKGETKLWMRFQTGKLARTKENIKAASEEHGHTDLFSMLKELRNRMAKEKSVPSYIIFSDKTLHDMCQLMPRNADEFLLVHGVGQSKLENYGKAFLREISTYQSSL